MTSPNSKIYWCSRSVVVLSALLFTITCSDASGPPATFGVLCDATYPPCAAPYSCLKWSLGPGSDVLKVCTKACRTTSECPSWTDSGHCAGDKQSECHDGLCRPPSPCD